MADFADVVRKRRMVRNFTDEPVAPEVLERIIATAQRAPSAGFSQGVVFVSVTDVDTRLAIGRIGGEDNYVEGGFDPFISSAPVQVVICTNEQLYHDRYNERDKVDDDGNEIHWPIPYWHTDAGCSLMLLLLAAVNEGLGSAFIGVPNPRDLQDLEVRFAQARSPLTGCHLAPGALVATPIESESSDSFSMEAPDHPHPGATAEFLRPNPRWRRSGPGPACLD